MKKIISLLLITMLMFGLFGCSDDPNMITIYEFKDDYDAGTPITKSMFKAKKISLTDGFVASDGTVYTQEMLSGMHLVTRDNWNALVSRKSVLRYNMKAGIIFTPGYISNGEPEPEPTMGAFGQPQPICP